MGCLDREREGDQPKGPTGSCVSGVESWEWMPAAVGFDLPNNAKKLYKRAGGRLHLEGVMMERGVEASFLSILLSSLARDCPAGKEFQSRVSTLFRVRTDGRASERYDMGDLTPLPSENNRHTSHVVRPRLRGRHSGRERGRWKQFSFARKVCVDFRAVQ